jgi:hypothetical protein
MVSHPSTHAEAGGFGRENKGSNMSQEWDEFSKSLAEPLPRRESLRRLGLVFAGAALGPFGITSAWARGPDPCKAFCKCRNKAQQNQCLAACQACNGNTSRLCGSCGNYTCCASGSACCSGLCADLLDDVYNCGGCGIVCDDAGPNEYGACIDGQCVYGCVQGAVPCHGTCTFLNSDPNNCGACGHICPTSAPVCETGICVVGCTGYCPAGWCGGDGCGGECACPAGWECGETGWCSNPCVFPFILCDGICIDPTSDPFNCGGCYHQCAPSEVCAGGFCQGFSGGFD